MLSLSKRTSNSFESLSHLPFHYVLGMFNTLNKMEKEEEEARKAMAENGGGGRYSLPSLPQNVSTSSMSKYFR